MKTVSLSVGLLLLVALYHCSAMRKSPQPEALNWAVRNQPLTDKRKSQHLHPHLTEAVRFFFDDVLNSFIQKQMNPNFFTNLSVSSF